IRQPGNNLTRKTSRAEHRHTWLSFQVFADQTAVRLASQILQMMMAHLPRIHEQIRSQIAQEPAPGCIWKYSRRAKLAKLTHHRILANQWRMQAADHFQKKLISIASVVDLQSIFT